LTKRSKAFEAIKANLGAGYSAELDILIEQHAQTKKRRKSLEKQLKTEGEFLPRVDRRGNPFKIRNPVARELVKVEALLTKQLQSLFLAAEKAPKIGQTDDDFEPCEECHANIGGLHLCQDVYCRRFESGDYEYVRGPDKYYQTAPGAKKEAFPHFILRHKETGKRADGYLLDPSDPEFEPVDQAELDRWRQSLN
jgi:hypothetical protein